MSTLSPPAPCARDLALRIDVDAVSGGVTGEILVTCYPAHADDEAFVAALQRSVHANIAAIRGVLAGHLELDAVQPTEALAFAELSATLAIPVATLERAYLVGVTDFWRQWFDRCTLEAEEHGVPLADLVRDSTLLVLAYIDRVLMSVVSHYDRARSEMIRTREHARRTMLGRVLDGTAPADRLEVERALGYPVSPCHLAIALEGDHREAVEERVALARDACGAGHTLVHQSGARSWIGWLARSEPFTRRELEGLREALRGARAAIGEPWSGIEGLRRTCEEATAAAAFGASEELVVLYRDVRLDVLLLSDPARARRFVAEELGALAGPDPRLRLIRETLLVWLSTGSHVAAAARISVHENTVRNRVRQAEDLLPDGVTLERRTELQVALRVARALGGR